MFRSLCLALFLLLLALPCSAADTAWPSPDWEVATPASQQMDAAVLEKAKAWLESHNSKSGLVIRHGRIVGEWYFGGADQKTRFAAYSTSKSLSSMATGLAIADGKLALTDTVGKYLPNVEPAAKKLITVKQILSMTTGVKNEASSTSKTDLFSYVTKTVPVDFKPGEKWDYNNTGLSLLSPVFQQATGKEIDEVLGARVFQPIGMTGDDWTWEHREGHAIPYSGCHLTARAMGRIGLMVLNHGKWKDQQIVPAAWLAESIAPSQDLNKAYGYLWWNNTANKWPNVPADAYAALGKWDNNIFIVPSLDLVVVRQSDLAPAKGHQIAEYLRLACEAAKK